MNKCLTNVFINFENRKALKTLQDIAGVYGLVVPCEEVHFPGVMVGHFTGGEPLRAVLPKGKVEGTQQRRMNVVESIEVVRSHEEERSSVVGYGVQLTFDVRDGNHNGILDVRVCWHDIVYQAQVDFAKKELLY
jgi:hypothetical protein